MESAAPALGPSPTRRPDRGWLGWTALFWIAAMAVMLAYKWGAIHWFALGDTDDNIRMSQVRDLLRGQGWYDLRQYRLDPPAGASIHWSRLVDLPIAGLILALRPILGGADAERWAVAIAPMLALLPALAGVALAMRRLVAPPAYALAAALMFCAQATMLMFMPLRIDHHGWQLTMLILVAAGSADPQARRGGLTVGVASAVSLTIGLEMLPYVAIAAAAAALRWVAEPDQAPRLRAHGIALGTGSAIGFAGFASYDNRALLCDALTPVWLSVTIAGGLLFVALAALRTRDWRLRLAAAAAAGAALAIGFALAFPQCLGRPEHISPELQRLWFDNIREVKPIYRHPWRSAVPIAALPIIGALGALAAGWAARGGPRLPAWATMAALSCFASAMLLWQTRAGPSAQLLAVPGAAWLGWLILPRTLDHRAMAVRVLGSVAAFLLISGLAVSFAVNAVPEPAAPAARARGGKPIRNMIAQANGRCPTLPALRPIARLPRATILTFVDLGPRLITVTHHSAIAGPYHRNGAAILDVHHAFRGTPATAHEVMRRHGATLLLICPGMSESTVYIARARGGFYWQLVHGRVPAWLAPVALPAGSPFRLWRRIG